MFDFKNWFRPKITKTNAYVPEDTKDPARFFKPGSEPWNQARGITSTPTQTPTPTPRRVAPTITKAPPMPTVTRAPQLPAQVPRPTAIPTPNPRYAVAPDFESTLNTYVFPHTRAEGLPDAVSAGQTGVESAYGQSDAAKTKNNYHGIMQWDDKGNRSLRSFPSASDSAKMYAQTVKKILKQKGYDVTKMNADQILDALQTGTPRYEGDNPDPKHYSRYIKNLSVYKRYNY